MKAYILKHFKLLLGGLASGFVGALFGAGGGMLTVPVLKHSGVSQKQAHACSVAVIMPLSIASAALYVLNDKVELSDAIPFIPFGVIGAFLGTWLIKKLPDRLLKKIFAVFMVWAGVRLFLK